MQPQSVLGRVSGDTVKKPPDGACDTAKRARSEGAVRSTGDHAMRQLWGTSNGLDAYSVAW